MAGGRPGRAHHDCAHHVCAHHHRPTRSDPPPPQPHGFRPAFVYIWTGPTTDAGPRQPILESRFSVVSQFMRFHFTTKNGAQTKASGLGHLCVASSNFVVAFSVGKYPLKMVIIGSSLPIDGKIFNSFSAQFARRRKSQNGMSFELNHKNLLFFCHKILVLTHYRPAMPFRNRKKKDV